MHMVLNFHNKELTWFPHFIIILLSKTTFENVQSSERRQKGSFRGNLKYPLNHSSFIFSIIKCCRAASFLSLCKLFHFELDLHSIVPQLSLSLSLSLSHTHTHTHSHTLFLYKYPLMNMFFECNLLLVACSVD